MSRVDNFTDTEIESDLERGDTSQAQQQQVLTRHTSKNTKSKQQISNHRRVLPIVRCDVCGKDIIKKGYKAHMTSVHRNIRKPCEKCGKSIAVLQYDHHMKIHDPNRKKFQCRNCSSAYLTTSSLKRHIRLSHFSTDVDAKDHLQLNPFNCTECPNTYTSMQALNTHKIQCHAFGTRCQRCKKIFANKYRIKSHKCDLPRKEYMCRFCNEKVDSLDRLQLHLEEKHVKNRNLNSTLADNNDPMVRAKETVPPHDNFPSAERSKYDSSTSSDDDDYMVRVKENVPPHKEIPPMFNDSTEVSSFSDNDNPMEAGPSNGFQRPLTKKRSKYDSTPSYGNDPILRAKETVPPHDNFSSAKRSKYDSSSTTSDDDDYMVRGKEAVPLHNEIPLPKRLTNYDSTSASSDDDNPMVRAKETVPPHDNFSSAKRSKYDSSSTSSNDDDYMARGKEAVPPHHEIPSPKRITNYDSTSTSSYGDNPMIREKENVPSHEYQVPENYEKYNVATTDCESQCDCCSYVFESSSDRHEHICPDVCIPCEYIFQSADEKRLHYCFTP